ncbi:MAG: hypothetical protein IAE88_01540 [Rhodobacteraceae bacterium]|nr:hypothetical protein [Paracoccaceae bacterium]MCB1941328.1 hypothetical protein [Accumulibacter sp.]
MPKLTGTPINNAINDVLSVPQIEISAPHRSPLPARVCQWQHELRRQLS